ncbi:MAG: DUF2156 domain-containing protein [Candidatus Omnitrophica bacterium]|nr:DUF2156 domain-containing protein [Candidatus Omnitrophota bacterium]
MPIEQLSFHHKDLLRERLKNVQTSLSEYSFANLFLFRGMHHYEVLSEKNEIFIIGTMRDGRRYVMPTLDPRLGDNSLLFKLSKNYDCIFPIAEEWLDIFDADRFTRSYHDDDSDYIYTVDQLSTYKGQKLHGQKNLLNQFFLKYTPNPQPLTKECMPDGRTILNDWQIQSGENKEATDYYPCLDALEKYDELVLCGGIYYVDQEPAGFMIGEEINEKMFLVHFAKGLKKFKGIYQYMYNQFAKILPNKYIFMNFEQDMGKTVLKAAKLSYHPDQILKKYRIQRIS